MAYNFPGNYIQIGDPIFDPKLCYDWMKYDFSTYYAVYIAGQDKLTEPVPMMTSIQGGMIPGKIIYITGRSTENASRFTVNLTCGADDIADIALHFDVRFNHDDSSCHVVVRNYRQGGNYGPSKRDQNCFPFSPGANFEIAILADHASYKIAVNNQHFVDFDHQIDPTSVKHLKVKGDVILTQIRFLHDGR